MKTYHILENRAARLGVRLATHGCLASVLVGLISYSWSSGTCQAQAAASEEQGAEVLTRGPVHEAFAGIVTFNPEPGVVVTKAPPDPIEEIPPAERPEGSNITWIPGYWAWDDERNDFLWVSGTWRALPPGREWIPGYWAKVTDGYQWTSGYWADAAAEETTYLPAPPKSLEDGPSTKAPSRDYGWTPGNWAWQNERYAWSPGYWAQGRSDWDWMPAHYVWTPRGYVFVDGYWDYSVARRGMLFAPVYYNSGLYSRSGYNYTPSIVLDLALFAEHLFLRPNYHHYYFGDYYDRGYDRGGYYAAYAYQSNRYGYDPIYSHQRWQHRQDSGWSRLAETNYRYRRDHENARPPRTWDAMRKMDATSAVAKQNRLMVAAPLDQMAKRKNGPVRLQEVSKEDRQMLTQRGKEVQKSREQRRTLESTGVNTAALKPGETAQPVKVKLPRSPIVGKAASEFSKKQAPPAVPRVSKAALVDPTKTGMPGREPKLDKNPTQPENRKGETTPREKLVKPDTGKPEATPHKKLDQPEPRKSEVTPREKQSQPEPRKTEPAPRERQAQPEPRRTEPAPRERQAQPEPRRTEPAPRERQAQPERSSKGSENKVQRTPDQPSKSKADSGGDEKSDKKKDHKKDSNR